MAKIRKGDKPKCWFCGEPLFTYIPENDRPAMNYRRFLTYNVIGGILWICTLLYAGYLFGNIPWVKRNLTLIVVAIVVVSLIPAVTTFVKEHARSGARREGVGSEPSGIGAKPDPREPPAR